MNRIFFGEREFLFSEMKPEIPVPSFEYNDIKDWAAFVQKDFEQNLVFIHTPEPRDCFLRFLQNFRVVPAAGGLVKTRFEEDEKYLYIFRNGMWDLPKGKKEAGENDESNALREVEEETGMKGLEILRYLDHTYHFMAARDGGAPLVKQTAWFLMYIPDPQPPVPQTEEGIEKAEWLSLSEIKNILGLMYTSVATLSNRFLLEPCRP